MLFVMGNSNGLIFGNIDIFVSVILGIICMWIVMSFDGYLFICGIGGNFDVEDYGLMIFVLFCFLFDNFNI